MRSRVLPAVVWLSLAASATGVGLATVSAVRGVVADEPVRVLSAAEVEDLLHEPNADLDPIATLTASDSVPKGASRVDDEGRQVDSREAVAQAEADRSNVPTNADDRPSRLGSDPGTLAGTRGGPARTTRRTGLRADEVEPSGGNPRAPQPTVAPTPSVTGTPSATPPSSPSAAPSTSPSTTPSGEPTTRTPTPSPSPSAPSPSPSPSGVSPSPTAPPSSATPTPSVTPPTASATSTSTPVPTPTTSATRPPLRIVVRSATTTGWGVLLSSR